MYYEYYEYKFYMSLVVSTKFIVGLQLNNKTSYNEIKYNYERNSLNIK